MTNKQNELMSMATSQTRAYVCCWSKNKLQFMDLLCKDPEVTRLADWVKKPGYPKEHIQHFYIELRGMKNQNKLRVLNYCLVSYSLILLVTRQTGKLWNQTRHRQS